MGHSEPIPEYPVPGRNRTTALNDALEAGDLDNIMGIMGEMARAQRMRRVAEEKSCRSRSREAEVLPSPAAPRINRNPGLSSTNMASCSAVGIPSCKVRICATAPGCQ